jgi:protocatechuate 3,4-dioxygenase beta subunit
MRGVWLLLLLTGCCWAQQGEYVLAGSVVNSRTGEPVKRALVTAFRLATPADMGDGLAARPKPAQPFSATAFTDVSGTFRFTSLTSGTYSLSAQKPHFTEPTTERQPVRIESSSQENLRLDLSPLGTIEGKITDQHGQPVSAANVLLMQSKLADGWRQTAVERTVGTDDRGVFRFWDITPGQYLVRAEAAGGNTIAYEGDSRPHIGGGYSGFAPTYFGGPTADSAAPVAIEAGTEARADIDVVLQPAYNVRGRLGNRGEGPMNFALVSNGEDVASGRSAFDQATGAFEMFEVVSGTYTLRATQGSAVAEAPIVVKDGNVSGLEMTLVEGEKIPVNVQVLGQPEESVIQPGDRRGRAQSRSGSCMVVLHGGPGSGPRIWFPSNNPVPPGQYRVSLNCFQAYVVSATMGNTDLTGDPSITVVRGAQPVPIEVVARYGGGTINGTVKLDTVPRDGSVFVLAVSRRSFPEPTLVPVPDRSGGQFVLGSLAPGDYTIYAFSTDQIEYRNPEFLRGLAGGESVHVEDGTTATVTITRLAQ